MRDRKRRGASVRRPQCLGLSLMAVAMATGCSILLVRTMSASRSVWFWFTSDLLPPTVWLDMDQEPTRVSLSQASAVPLGTAASSAFQDVCWSDACLQDLGLRIARAFPRRPRKSWCLRDQSPSDALHIHNASQPQQLWQGLLFVKVPKAASSTTAGVMLHIQKHTGCAVQYHHREGRDYAHRDTTRSFLLGAVRDPADRALSAVHYFVVGPALERTDLLTNDTTHMVLQGLHSRQAGRTKGKGGFQYNYLSMVPLKPYSVTAPWEPHKVKYTHQLLDALQRHVIDSYDLLLVVERLDESLLALSMLTDLPPSVMTLLVASAKVTTATGQSPYLLVRTGRHKHTCQWKQRPPQPNQPIQAYLQSDEWKWINYADYILHAAANASLDRTIDETIGRDAFEKDLRKFRRMQDYVLEFCGERILGTGCTMDGQVVWPMEECYENDL